MRSAVAGPDLALSLRMVVGKKGSILEFAAVVQAVVAFASPTGFASDALPLAASSPSPTEPTTQTIPIEPLDPAAVSGMGGSRVPRSESSADQGFRVHESIDSQIRLPVGTDERLRGCGQSCLYQQTVSRLEIERQTILGRLANLESKDEAAAKSSLGNFCSARESGGTCLVRFRRTQLMRMHEVRQQIAEANDHYVRLQADFDAAKLEFSGKPPRLAKISLIDAKSAQAVQGTAQIQALVPPSYDELARSSVSKVRPSQMERELPRAVAQVFGRAPRPEDFVRMKTILRNPQDPSMGSLIVVVRDAQGNPELDEQAYALALKDFRAFADEQARQGAGGRPELAWGRLGGYSPTEKPGKFGEQITSEARTAYIQAYSEFQKAMVREEGQRIRAPANGERRDQYVKMSAEALEDNLRKLSASIQRQ